MKNNEFNVKLKEKLMKTNVFTNNYLLIMGLIIEAFILAYLGYISNSPFNFKIVYISLYFIILVLSIAKIVFFKKWQRIFIEKIKNIELFANIYAIILITGGTIINTLGWHNSELFNWYILSNFVICISIPIINNINTKIYIVSMIISFCLISVLGVIFFNDNFSYHTCVYIALGYIMGIFIQLSKEKMLEESLNDVCKAEVTAELQINVTRELLKENDRLNKSILLDPLTKLYNRYALGKDAEDLWQLAYKEENKICLVMLDIDNFKYVNDTYGHLAGDACLKFVASFIHEYVISANGTAYRYGGEEFLVIFYNKEYETISEYIKELTNNIEKSYLKELPDFTIRLSYGMYQVIPNDKNSFDSVLSEADRRMYINKTKHKKKRIS